MSYSSLYFFWVHLEIEWKVDCLMREKDIDHLYIIYRSLISVICMKGMFCCRYVQLKDRHRLWFHSYFTLKLYFSYIFWWIVFLLNINSFVHFCNTSALLLQVFRRISIESNKRMFSKSEMFSLKLFFHFLRVFSFILYFQKSFITFYQKSK